MRLTWYVVDIEEYLANLETARRIYREAFGSALSRHGAGPGGSAGRECRAGRNRGDSRGAALNLGHRSSCKASAIRASFWSIAATWLFRASI